MPEYVTRATAYNLSGVITRSSSSLAGRMQRLRVSDTTVRLADGVWPPAEALGLDPSQYEAFKVGLTHELAIIQGMDNSYYRRKSRIWWHRPH